MEGASVLSFFYLLVPDILAPSYHFTITNANFCSIGCHCIHIYQYSLNVPLFLLCLKHFLSTLNVGVYERPTAMSETVVRRRNSLTSVVPTIQQT